MNFKRIAAATLAATMALSLMACGSSESTSTSTGSTEENAVVELTYWYSWTDKVQENNLNLTEQFNETIGAEKGIHVTAEYQGSYDDLHQKLQAAHVAGDVPNVTVMEIASTKTFAENGVIDSLDSYIQASGVDMSDYYEGLLTNCKVDDSWYGVPYLRSTPILYLNTTILEECGLDTTGPKNFDELATYCRTINEKTGKYGLVMYSYIWTFEAFGFGNNTSILSEDEMTSNLGSEAYIEIGEFFQGLVDEGVIRVVAGTDSSKLDPDIVNQNTGMWLGSTGSFTNYYAISEENAFGLNTCFIPGKETFGVPTGGCNLIMTSKSSDAQKDAAWEFIHFMTSADQAAYSSEYTGYVPTSTSATNTDRIQNLYKEMPQYQVALDQLELYGHGRPMNPNYEEAQVEVISALDACWVNGANVRETFTAAAEKMNKLLAE